MKRAALLLALCASVGFAQQPGPPAPARPGPTSLTERVQAPTYSDLYCAGFISKEAFSQSNYIMGGAQSPHQAEFNQGSILYLEGTAYTEGARFTVLRALRDPNRARAFHGQSSAISDLGQPYAELGRVRVIALRDKIAVAEVEFSCSAMSAGDIVVPFQEKAPVALRPVRFETFPAGQAKMTARIVMAKDFDWVVGTGQKVYLSAGADKGVKVGDYFHALGTSDPDRMEPNEALSFKTPHYSDTQKHPVSVSKSKFKELPRRAVAQLVVLNVTPTSSTAMITFAKEPLNVGDVVELEGEAQP